MFQFPGLAFDPYVFRAKYLHLKTGNPKLTPRFRDGSLGVPVFEGGFPHSEISGSKPIRGSPKLIAAYHVLLRLLAPRHPPNALKTLDRSHRRCPPLGRGPCPELLPAGGFDVFFEKTSFALSTMARSAPNDRIERCRHLPHDPTVLPRYSRSMPYSRCHTAVHGPPETGMMNHAKQIIRGQDAQDPDGSSANHPAIIFLR